MAMRWFGGSPHAVVDPETGAWLPSDSGSVWTDETGGERITDLYDENEAPIADGDIFTDEYGYAPLVGVDEDPPVEVVWLDFTGGARRVRMECRDRADYRLAEQDKDAPNGVAGLNGQRHLDPARLPPLPASVIGHGEFAEARIPDLSHLYVAASGGGVGDPLRFDETRLRALRAALGDVEQQPVDVLAVGDSITEGSKTTRGRRWTDQLLRLLRKSYQPADVTGGEGYVPVWQEAPSVDDRWSGSYTTRDDLGGLGVRTADVPAGNTLTFDFTGTGLDIHHAKAGIAGTFRWRIDGGSWTSVDANASDPSSGHRATVRGLDSGPHTLEVEAVDRSFIEGAMVYDGDEGAGVRMWEGGHGGYNSEHFQIDSDAHWLQSAELVDPDLVIIGLGINDFRDGIMPSTMRSNIETIIGELRNRSTRDPSVIVTVPYETNEQPEAAAEWSAFRQALLDLAELDGAVTVVDHEAILGAPVNGDPLDVFTEQLHPNGRGYGALAQALHGVIVRGAL